MSFRTYYPPFRAGEMPICMRVYEDRVQLWEGMFNESDHLEYTVHLGTWRGARVRGNNVRGDFKPMLITCTNGLDQILVAEDVIQFRTGESVKRFDPETRTVTTRDYLYFPEISLKKFRQTSVECPLHTW